MRRKSAVASVALVVAGVLAGAAPATAGGAPNLQPTALANPPGARKVHAKFDASITTANVGGADAGASTTRLYLSIDEVRSSDDAKQKPTVAIGPLGSGATSPATVSVKVTVPATGDYFLLACVDVGKDVVESDESDNCIASSTTMHVTGPDLAVTDVTDPPAVMAPGESFSVTDITTNVGDAKAATSTTSYFLSLDGASSPDDIRLSGERPVATLLPGTNSGGSTPVSVPAGTPSATYQLLACADGLERIYELNGAGTGEANNCLAAGTTVTIAACGGALPYGVTISCEIELQGESDSFSINASFGQRLVARAVRPPGGTGTVQVQALNSQGVVVAGTGFQADAILEFSVGSAGVATIRVNGGPATANQPYNVGVQRLNPPAGCAAVALGSTSPEAISIHGEEDCFTFAASPGDVVYARATRTSGTGLFHIQLFDNEGIQRCAGPGQFPDVTTQCAVPMSGGYVRVTGGTFTASSTYNLTVQRMNGPAGCTPVALGSTTPGALEADGEYDCFSFTTSGTVRAHAVRTSGTGVFNVWIYDTNGVQRCNAGIFSNDVTVECAVPTAGGHVAVFGNTGTSNTGYDVTIDPG